MGIITALHCHLVKSVVWCEALPICYMEVTLEHPTISTTWSSSFPRRL